MKKTNRLIDKMSPYSQTCAHTRGHTHDPVERPCRSRIYAFSFPKEALTCSHLSHHNKPAAFRTVRRLLPYYGAGLTEANQGRRFPDITLWGNNRKCNNMRKFPAVTGKGAILADEAHELAHTRQMVKRAGGFFSKTEGSAILAFIPALEEVTCDCF